MKKRSKPLSAIVFFLAFSFMIIAGGKVAFAEKSEIVFGVSIPLTGAFPYGGELEKMGYLAWEGMVNERGGIYVKEYGKKLPVRLVYYDDKSNPTTTAKIYEKLINGDKVDFVLSPWGSSAGFAASHIAQKYKTPLVFVWTSSDPIFKQGYDYVFCLIQPASRHCWSAVQVLKDKKLVKDPPKKLYFLAAKELYPMTTIKGAMEYAKVQGFEVYYEEVEKGCRDFTPVITKMRRIGVDAITTSIYHADFFLFFRQAMELAFRPRYLYAQHSNVHDFVETFGEKAAEGVLSNGFWGNSWNTKGNQEFIAFYRKKWKKDPEMYAITAAGCQVMHQAIEKAGTLDKEKVKKVLEVGEFNSMFGPAKFVNEAGYTNLNKLAFTGLQQWQGEKLLMVYPELVAEAKFIYPKPWSK